MESKKQQAAAAPEPQDGEKIAELPGEQPTAAVAQKKKEAAAAPEPQVVEKKAEVPAGKQAAPVENKKKKKKNAAAPEQQVAAKNVTAPAEEQPAPLIRKKKAAKPANTVQKGQSKCDPLVENCAPAQKLVNLNHLSTKRVIQQATGAESWRTNCSARFGGGIKTSQSYLSSAGKRVSCAWRPKNVSG